MNMTRDAFLAAIRQSQIDPTSFDLNECKNERYILSRANNQWVVFYSERGLQTNPHEFASEADALEHLLTRLLRDPTTRVRTKGSSH